MKHKAKVVEFLDVAHNQVGLIQSAVNGNKVNKERLVEWLGRLQEIIENTQNLVGLEEEVFKFNH